MKKLLLLVVVFGFALSACLPALPQTETASTPAPILESDLQATAAVLSEQTLAALPSPTVAPSETPVVLTPTNTEVPVTPTETENPFLLTLTATLGTGTVTPDPLTGTPDVSAVVGTFPATLDPLQPPPTAQPLFHGTLPPALTYGSINLFNKSHVDAYISLRCVTKEGYVTILEYPVKRQVITTAPTGKYTYVAWVGGRQFTGSFSLQKDENLLINLFKDKITIKKN